MADILTDEEIDALLCEVGENINDSFYVYFNDQRKALIIWREIKFESEYDFKIALNKFFDTYGTYTKKYDYEGGTSYCWGSC